MSNLASHFHPDVAKLALQFGDFLKEAAGGRRADRTSFPERPLNPLHELFGDGIRYDSKSLRADATAFVQKAFPRLDASFTSMFARQLEYFYTWTADVEYPELRARQLVPVDTEVPSGADYYTYRMYDVAAKAAMIHNYAKNSFPESDVFGDEFKQAIKGVGSKYSYSVQDMRAAAMAGVPLEAKKASAARYAIEKRLEAIACYGDTATSLYGVTNAPGVQAVAKISPNGTWAAQIVAAIQGGTLPATSQAINQDVMAMAEQIYSATLGTHKPTTLVLPTAAYGVLATTPWSPVYRDESILQFLMKGNPWIDEIVDWAYLNSIGQYTFPGITFTLTNASASVTASASLAAWASVLVAGAQLTFVEQPGVTYTLSAFNGTTGLTLTANYTGTTNSTHGAAITGGLALLYEKNPRVLQLVIPQEFEQFPPEIDGMNWDVLCHLRTGGVNAIRPLAIATMAGIS